MKKKFVPRLTALLLALAALFLALTVLSSVWSVRQAEAAIDAIPAVEYSEQVHALIRLANGKYTALDQDLDLQSWVANQERLLTAKIEYARLAIKEAYLAIQNGEPEEDVRALVYAAQGVMEEFFAPDEYELVSNYADLQAAVESLEGAESQNAAPSEESGGEEEIELC